MLEFEQIFLDIHNVIHPENRLKSCWDFLVLAVAVFGALEIPLFIVFDLTSYILLNVSNWLIPAVFAVDIIVSFNTAFPSQGKIVTNRKEVARKYLRGWFWIDLVAALPVGLVLAALPVPEVSVLRFIKLVALLKLLHSTQTLQRLGGARINPAIFRLFLLIFWVFLAAHFVSCGWIYISGNPAQLDPVSRYIEAFYWTITTLSTIGYGDITPSGNVQIVYVVLIELLGAGMYGLIIGNIANLIANIDVAKTQYKEKLDKINTFLKYRNIPYQLQKKVDDYYSYLWESRRGYDESSVLKDLPVPLQVSVSLFLNKEIIEKVPIFEDAGEDLIKDIIMNLRPVVFTPGDYIVTAGEVGFDMYFISKGSVDVVSVDEKTHYATLVAGQFFGEIALLLSIPRTATIKAKEYCDLYRLDKETFDQVLARYPEFAETIQELADKRRAELGAVKEEKEQAEPTGAEPEKAEGKKEEAEPAVPEVLEGIKAVQSGSAVKLRWNSVREARHYKVIKRFPETEKWMYLTKKSTEPAFVDERFLPDRPNIYSVRAVGISGPGAWSRPVIVKKST